MIPKYKLTQKIADDLREEFTKANVSMFSFTKSKAALLGVSVTAIYSVLQRRTWNGRSTDQRHTKCRRDHNVLCASILAQNPILQQSEIAEILPGAQALFNLRNG